MAPSFQNDEVHATLDSSSSFHFFYPSHIFLSVNDHSVYPSICLMCSTSRINIFFISICSFISIPNVLQYVFLVLKRYELYYISVIFYRIKVYRTTCQPHLLSFKGTECYAPPHAAPPGPPFPTTTLNFSVPRITKTKD